MPFADGRGFLRARAAAAGLDIEVHSAGSMSGGAPATAAAIATLAERGIDISGHRAVDSTGRWSTTPT